jgi:predicted dienelactone hydrolase
VTPRLVAQVACNHRIARPLLLALALSVSLVVGGSMPAFARVVEAPAPAVLRPTLPPPIGNQNIGVVSLHLADHSRPDPWVSSQPVRELMVSVWYPARRAHAQPVYPWLPPSAWERFEQDNAIPPGNVRVPLTHARVDAPLDRHRGGRPLILYPPGLGGNRDSSTVLVEELVSRGYVVATIDHTHDAGEVEFPDGRVEVSAVPPITPEVVEKAVAVRVADTRFVLDSLVALNAGRNPDAEQRPLPAGLRGALDLSRVGMFGHSLGGATAAQAMYEDRRIKAGVNLDGTMAGAVVNAGLNRPFMLVAAQNHGRDTDPSWARFWTNLRGWRLNLRLTGAGHNSFSDVQVLLPQIAGVLHLPPEYVQQFIGTVDPHRSVLIQRAYLTAFFNLHLLHRDGRLLTRPSPRFPEMQFVP